MVKEERGIVFSKVMGMVRWLGTPMAGMDVIGGRHDGKSESKQGRTSLRYTPWLIALSADS